MMSNFPTNPRVLIVTPEITYLPKGMGNISNGLNAKAGGLADVSAALINELYGSGNEIKNIRISLAFQREVINNIVPRVQPDLIHCNDWMTGLIPAMARQLGIPCLFTIHNIHTVKTTLSEIEDRGIDGASFWQNFYYEYLPTSYENTRDSIPVDFLTSGAFAAHFVNLVSPTFLKEMVEGRHGFVKNSIQCELANKHNAGCAVGILNAPDSSYNPCTDEALPYNYSAKNHVGGKKTNKRILQKTLGLIQEPQAPLFFWPSRLDPVQKGCQLLAEILYNVVSRYLEQNLEMVFVADGEYQRHFEDIVRFHNLSDRVAVCSFNERLARLAYGASDFVLMPSSFEPCGLPQMIGPIYGALPVAHDTGGIHDTVTHLDLDNNTGNGFLFNTFDPGGLSWAIDQAMQFYLVPAKEKKKQVKRIMMQGAATFNHKVTAQHYIDLYEKMLQRPLVKRQNTEPIGITANSDKKAHNEQKFSDAKSHGITSDRADQQNIISLSKNRRPIEKRQPKLLRVNE